MTTTLRPYKVWSCDRDIRKSVVAASLIELKVKGSEKLGYGSTSLEQLRLVLESDGTEIEDDTYFQTSDKDTVFLLLKKGEKWLPPGVEALKAAITAVPGIVCDALNKMELVDKPPSWKIMDNRGNVTVVLHWDHRDRISIGGKRVEPTWRVEVVSSKPSDQTNAQTYKTVTSNSTSSTITPTSASRAKLSLDGLRTRPPLRSLPTQRPSSPIQIQDDDDDDDDSEDEKTEREISPTHDHSQCDFHCSAFHREGTQIHVNKSVATSPIQESTPPILLSAMSASADNISATKAIPKKTGVKGHVRWKDISADAESNKNAKANGSDSETETTEKEDEQICERYLLLVDQLSIDQDRHLSLKDIGIILERLNSKIIDVDKLEREKDGTDCFNWIIKATIRGEVLREIGVIYNGQYYGIMEHPGYF